MSPESSQAFQDLATQQSILKETMAAGLADARLAPLYTTALDDIEKRQAELIDEVANEAQASVLAVQQLELLEGLVDPEELKALRGNLSEEARAAFDLVEKHDTDRERVERLETIMLSAGILAVAEAAEITEVAEPQVDTSPAIPFQVQPDELPQIADELSQPVFTEDDSTQVTPEHQDTVTLSTETIGERIASLTDEQIAGSMTPAQLWQAIGGSPDGSMRPNDRVHLGDAVRLEGRLHHNGKRGRGSLYLRAVGNEAAVPQADILSMREAATIASFMELVKDVLAEQGISPPDSEAIERLYGAVELQPDADQESLQRDRLEALQKIVSILNDDALFDDLVNSIAESDPRYPLVEYLVQEHNHIDAIRRLLDARRKVSITEYVRRRGAVIVDSEIIIAIDSMAKAQPAETSSTSTIPEVAPMESATLEPAPAIEDRSTDIESPARRESRVDLAAELNLKTFGKGVYFANPSVHPWLDEGKEIPVSVLGRDTDQEGRFRIGNLIGGSKKLRDIANDDLRGKPGVDDQLNRALLVSITSMLEGKFTNTFKLDTTPNGRTIYYVKFRNGCRAYFTEVGADEKGRRTFMKLAICTTKDSQAKVLSALLGNGHESVK